VREIRLKRGIKQRLDEGWDRQTRKKPAVPCRVIEIMAGKCGFAGQLERQKDRSDPLVRGNAIPVLTYPVKVTRPDSPARGRLIRS
jgi:hypothetical protein